MLCYVATDGDKIGRQVGRAAEDNDTEKLRRISQAIDHGNEIIKSWVELSGGEMISYGGDESRFQVPADKLDEIPGIRRQYAEAVGSTISVGIGLQLREADRALMSAKIRGGDQVVFYSEEAEEDIKAAQSKHENTTEAEKLFDEYLGKAAHQGMAHPVAPAQAVSPTMQEGSMSPGMAAQHELTRDDRPAAPELTHTAQDFEKQFHDLAGQQDSKDQQEAAKKAQNVDALKAQVVAVLQQVKQAAPILAQMQQTAPQVYQAVQQMTQSMILLAQEVASNQPIQKSDPLSEGEDLMKAKLPKKPKKAFKAPPDQFVEGKYPTEADDGDLSSYVGKIHLGGRGNLNGMPWDTQFQLQDMPVAGLPVHRQPDDDAANRYAKLKTPFPPIVMLGNDRVFDGTTRIAAARLRGDKTIRAYLPVKKSDDLEKQEAPAPEKPKSSFVGYGTNGKHPTDAMIIAVRHALGDHPSGCEGGHCYIANEALYHLMGGDQSGWRPHVLNQGGKAHWFLKHLRTGRVLDATADKFPSQELPYHLGKQKKFVTEVPSKLGMLTIKRVLGKAPEVQEAQRVSKDELEPSKKPKEGESLDKIAIGHVAKPHHIEVKHPVGAEKDGKIKVMHQNGQSGWVEVRSGQIMSQDPTQHPISSRNPGGR